MSYEYFEVSPKIIPVRKPTVITIRPRYEQRSFKVMMERGTFSLRSIAEDGLMDNGDVARWAQYNDEPLPVWNSDSDSLTFTVCLNEEGEKSYSLMYETNGRKSPLLNFALYALEDDLFQLRPFRGDMHVHTSYSECGNRDENPRFVVAYACESGLDYVAITDHAQMEPSVLAVDFIKPFQLDFQVFRGEEVHILPRHEESLLCHNCFLPTLHFVNFGGTQGVVKYQNEHFDEVQDIIHEKMKAFPETENESVRFMKAASDWALDKIHEFGGVAIFAHPFWKTNDRRNNLPAPIREYILERERFDAIEVIGLGKADSHRESNLQAIAWWQQNAIKRGGLLPIVGDTDSHSTRSSLNTRATIVFARDNSFDAIAEAIRAGRSVAGTFYDGESAHLFGDYRYVDFAYYLIREFYPEHDQVSKFIGGILRAHLRGLCSAADVTAAGKGKLTALFNKYWAD